MNAVLEKKMKKNIDKIPLIKDFTKMFFYLNNNDVDIHYLNYFKNLTGQNDNIVSDWLNINARTLKNYLKSEVTLKDNTKEHIVHLIALYKHGIEIFGTKENFDNWLSLKNIFLDDKIPAEFLDTISGIKFIDSRLTAIEYGDNV